MDEPRTPDDSKASPNASEERLKQLNEHYRPKRTQSSGLAAFGTAGIELGLAVVLLTLGGWWLDKKFGTSPVLLLIGAAVGITGGLYRIFRTFNQLMK